MALRFEDNQGIQALDQNQIIEVFSGNSVSNGVDTTINSGNLGQSDTIQVSSGDVIVGGSKVSVSQQNQQIDSSDPENPRKDVVYIDSNGDVQVDKGTPEDPEPEGANRFDLFQPAPPDRDNVDGAVVAEVFVGAGDSSISSNDVRDRRLISDLTVDKLKFFNSLNFGDDQNLNFGDAPDFSIRYDSNDDELKIKDEVNDTEKQAFDKSGDVLIRNGALQVGKDIQTTGATTIWDSSATEIPDGALGTVDAGTLNLSNEFTNSSGTLNVDESKIDHDSLQNFVSNEHIDHSSVTVTGTGALTGGGDLTSSRTLDVATDGIGTDELDESANFSFSNLGATTITGDLDMSNNSINDVASIGGDADAVTANDDIDMNSNDITEISNLRSQQTSDHFIAFETSSINIFGENGSGGTENKFIVGTDNNTSTEFRNNKVVFKGSIPNFQVDTTTEIKVLNERVYANHSDFSGVQDALDWAESNGYATVEVGDGNYSSIDLNNGQSLVGIGNSQSIADNSTFDGGTSDHGILVNGRSKIRNVEAQTDDGGGSNFDAVHVDAEEGDSIRQIVNDCTIKISDRHGVFVDNIRVRVTHNHFDTDRIDEDEIRLGSNSANCVVDGNTGDSGLTITNNGSGNVIGDNV